MLTIIEGLALSGISLEKAISLFNAMGEVQRNNPKEPVKKCSECGAPLTYGDVCADCGAIH